MKKIHLNLTRLALGTTSYLIGCVCHAAAISATIQVEDNIVATQIEGTLCVAQDKALHKTGNGTFFLSGDHSGAGKLEGDFYADEGIVAFDHAGSLGAGVIMASGTSLQALADDVALAGDISLADGASIVIDANDHPSEFVGEIKQMGINPVTIVFENSGTQMTDLKLHSDYTAADANADTMIISGKVNISIDGNSNASSAMTVGQFRALNGSLMFRSGFGVYGGFIVGNFAAPFTDTTYDNEIVYQADEYQVFYINYEEKNYNVNLMYREQDKLSNYTPEEIFYDGVTMANGFRLSSANITYDTLADLTDIDTTQGLYSFSNDGNRKLWLTSGNNTRQEAYDSNNTRLTIAYFSGNIYIPQGGSIQNGFYSVQNTVEAMNHNPTSVDDSLIYSLSGLSSNSILYLNSDLPASIKRVEMYQPRHRNVVYMSSAGLGAGFYIAPTGDFNIEIDLLPEYESVSYYSDADDINGLLYPLPRYKSTIQVQGGEGVKKRLAMNVDMLDGSKLSITDNAELPHLNIKSVV